MTDAQILLAVLVLLQVKHFVWDFRWQPPIMLVQKGQYGQWWGIVHSALHGASTAIIIGLVVAPGWAWLGAVDFYLHYHIDYVKARFGSKNTALPKFWAQLGGDQLAHQVTYLGLAGAAALW